MNDDTVHINGKPATDAQLRKLTGLDSQSPLISDEEVERQAQIFDATPLVVNFNWTEPDANGFQHLAPCELWERHVAEKADRTEVTLNPSFWSDDDPQSDFPCWTDNDPDEWMNDRRDEAAAEWATFIEAGRA